MRRTSRPLIRILCLLSLLATPSTRAEEPRQRDIPAGQPERPLSVRLPKPGTFAAARFLEPEKVRGINVAMQQRPDGLYVPDRQLVTIDTKVVEEQVDWLVTRRAVQGYLRATGVRPSGLGYQRLARKISGRAESVLRQNGLTLEGWKTVVVEGGAADCVNACTWTGGLITLNRPLVDLAYQVGTIYQQSRSFAELDRNLWRLARWRGGQGARPLALDAQARMTSNPVGEAIVTMVLTHEMGHAAMGHVAIPETKIALPGAGRPFNAPAARQAERAADGFALDLGAAITPFPMAMPLFFYAMHIDHPTLKERGPLDAADWRSHPLDLERYNTLLGRLQELGFPTFMVPPALDPKKMIKAGFSR